VHHAFHDLLPWTITALTSHQVLDKLLSREQMLHHPQVVLFDVEFARVALGRCGFVRSHFFVIAIRLWKAFPPA
jgi:hypothetical protein